MVQDGKQLSTPPTSTQNGPETPPQYEEICEATADVLSETAEATDDGRITVNLDSNIARVLSKFIPVEDETDVLDSPPNHGLGRPWILPMNIVIQVVGSRGDVQPFVAIGNELQRSGHRVRLATHAVFKKFVRDAGLEFYPIGGDPAELMAYMVKNPGLIPNMKTLRKGDIIRKRRMIAEMLRGCWRSCIEPDPNSEAPFVANAVIANPVSFAHVHCAEALSIPLHLVFTMPWSPTRAFPHPLANIENVSADPRLANYLSYGLVQALTWQGLGDIINGFRRSLDLEDLPLTEAPFIAETLKIPYTYCWSPALVPKPADWPSHIDVSGFVFRSTNTYNYEPSELLTSFLNAGPAPLYIGFGSIVIDNPNELLSKILSAVARTGVRAIISKGWSDLSDTTTPNSNILYLGDCPHEYLFQHVSATIHHGGAGTTAASLLAGRPTLIIPFFGDQPFWGERVAAAGAGPSPIPHKKLTPESLVSAIEFLLTPAANLAAQGIAKTMATENGVKAAVDSFHHHLRLQALSCDIIPSQLAAYELNVSITTPNKMPFSLPQSRRIKVSASAAETLIKHNKIKPKDLGSYEANPILIKNRRWDPVTSASSSAVRVSYEVLKDINNIWYAPHKLRMEAKKNKSKQSKPTSKAQDQTTTLNHSASNTRHQPQPLTNNTDKSIQDQDSSSPSDTDSITSVSTAKLMRTSAKSIPHLTGTMLKSFLIDAPYAVAEGFRNTPKLYGEEVPDHEPVTDWRSGAVVGGREFSMGLANGLVDIFVQPYKGVKEDGAVGVVTGIGKGVVGTFTKCGTAALGLWAYPVQGAWRSVYDVTHGRTKKEIFGARRMHDLYYATRDKADEKKVLEAFERLQKS